MLNAQPHGGRAAPQRGKHFKQWGSPTDLSRFLPLNPLPRRGTRSFLLSPSAPTPWAGIPYKTIVPEFLSP